MCQNLCPLDKSFNPYQHSALALTLSSISDYLIVMARQLITCTCSTVLIIRLHKFTYEAMKITTEDLFLLYYSAL